MKTKIITAIAMLAFLGFTNATFSQENHPRKEQVNDRLKNQNKRINNEVKEGEMSKGKAAKLKSNDKKIRQEEKDMSSQNGGHITKQEQKTLNQQLNQNSKKIGN